MEVISEVTPMHYLIFLVLGTVSEFIIVGIIFKKIKKYKKFQSLKKQELLALVSKFEHALLKIQQCVEDYEKVDLRSKDLEIMSISGVVNHQLGHISRFRSYLK